MPRPKSSKWVCGIAKHSHCSTVCTPFSRLLNFHHERVVKPSHPSFRADPRHLQPSRHLAMFLLLPHSGHRKHARLLLLLLLHLPTVLLQYHSGCAYRVAVAFLPMNPLSLIRVEGQCCGHHSCLCCFNQNASVTSLYPRELLNNIPNPNPTP